MKRCPDCGIEKPLEQFHRAAKRADGRAWRCKSCTSDYMREYQQRRRQQPGYRKYHRDRQKRYREALWLEFLERYGARCACCGESESIFLTCDHVDGRETIDRGKTQVRVLMQAKREGWPDSYQILCWNCNSGRARNGGVCPHVEASAALA